MNNYGCNGVIEKMVTEKKLGNLYGYTGGNFAGNVYEKEGLCPSILTMQGGGKQPMITEEIIEIKQATKDAISTRGANIVSTIRASYHKNGERNLIENIETGKGYEGSQCGTVVSDEGLAPTLSAGTHGYANAHILTKQKYEENMSERQNSIKAKKLPNGNIRFYRDDEKKSAVSELQVQSKDNVAQAITTANVPKIYVETIYRIRKLTPKECWRLMGYTDADFDKAAFEKKELYIQGGNDKCNAKLKVVQEKPILTDTESFVSCTTSDIKSMETLKIIKKLLAEMPESERTQNVNFVITKSEGLEHLECATNTTKCITFMGMRCILTEEKDQLVMVITEQGKEVKQNTAKSMKITTESNLDQSKLYTILILTELIMKSGIYGCTTQKANIQGNIAITDVCENSIRLKISDLKMESTSVRVSSSQLYKESGNAIVRQVLIALFLQMGIQGKKRWNEMTDKERYEIWPKK